MPLTREIKILMYIHRHKAVTGKQLTKKFPDIDNFYHRLKKEYVREEKAKDVLPKSYLVRKHISDDEPIISLTIYGDDIALKRRHEFWNFILPYGITTIIAASSAIIQILNFICNHYSNH